MKKEIFLTFDMDYAIDEVLDDFYELIRKHNLVGLLNVTHETVKLSEWKADFLLEYGIHPNFNNLMKDGSGKNQQEILSEMMKIVPNAISLRSHSLTSSSILQALYDKLGIRYDLNFFAPPHDGLQISPWRGWNGNYIVIPFIFEDDIYLTSHTDSDILYCLSESFCAPRVFNFHPIHLFLNTADMAQYEKAKSDYKNINWLIKCRNEGMKKGIRDCFLELIAYAQSNGWTFKKISEGNWEAENDATARLNVRGSE